MNSKTYNRIVKSSRQKEITLRKETLAQIIDLLTGVNDDLSVAIAQAADQTGTLRKEQLQAIKSRIEQDLDVFENQYSYIAKSGIKGEVSLILERNGEIFIEAEGTKKLVDLLNDKIISQVLDYKEKDGLILSDRIWRITQEAKADITNRISQGMLLGESHVKVAKDLKQYIVGDGGLRYKSERLAMTEMAKAYQRANSQSVEMMRQNSEYMWFEKWELGPAHPKPDVCDILASQNIDGEGAGIYKHSPNRHPGCYCYIYPVYRPKRGTATYPNVSGKEPDTSDLDKSQYKLAKVLT